MKTKGHVYLKLAGVLEILLGVATIGLTLYLLSLNPSDYADMGGINVKDTLISLVWIYGSSAFQIVAGVFGIAFANNARKAGVCKFFGFVLIIFHFITISNQGFGDSTATAISNYISLLIPVVYMFGAILNGKD